MEKGVIKLLAVLFIGWIGISYGQEIPPLERTISLELKGESSQQALKKMEELGGYVFAYRTDLVSASDRLSRSYTNKRTREILDDLFQGKLSYKEKSNYIILRNSAELKPGEVVLEGYVLDKETQEKISYATLYDTVSLVASVSDEFGHFTMRWNESREVTIYVKKEGYRDTMVAFKPEGRSVLAIEMEATGNREDSTLNARWFDFLNLTPEQRANIQNFKQRFKKNSQFSLVPGVGTNGDLSPVTYVDYSFNLIGGFNAGVRQLELGLIFNLDFDSVRYFQAAGIANFVGGYQEGVQMAGLGNFNLGSFEGLQMASALNMVYEDFRGVQLSGGLNSTIGSHTGMQIASIGNYATEGKGCVQFSNLANVGLQNFFGRQFTFGVNYLGENSNASQLGLVNVKAFSGSGWQGGLVNYAENFKGKQYGLINISDSLDGYGIGFFNYCRQGLHQWELSANEWTYANIAYRTGTRAFYNIFSIEARPTQNGGLGYGYGLGTSMALGSRWYFNMDGTMSQMHTFEDPWRLRLKSSFFPHFEVQFIDNFGMAFGPTANLLMEQNNNGLVPQDVFSWTPYELKRGYKAGLRLQAWIGAKVAFRFF